MAKCAACNTTISSGNYCSECRNKKIDAARDATDDGKDIITIYPKQTNN